MLYKPGISPVSSLIFAAIITAQCSLARAQSSQETISVTQAAIKDFRQISVRILSAYKVHPRYIGSTEQWHLFLKKESRHAVDKEFSSIFGYKISTQGNSNENGWNLKLPTIEINPDNCPEVTQYKKDKRGFSLSADTTIAARCLGQ